MDWLSDLVFEHGKTNAFVLGGAIAATGAFVLCAAGIAVLASIGWSGWHEVIPVSLGCAIGTGAVNAVMAAIHA
jgi:hypothetical protein